MNAERSLVVVSPAGGVGEVAAVKAASKGNSVKWFVVSPPEKSNIVNLSQESLNEIDRAGGTLEIAGADAASLILPMEDPSSSLPSVSSWTGRADDIICTVDGAFKGLTRRKGDNEQKDPELEELVQIWKNAVKVAGKEASKLMKGEKIAIESVNEEILTAAQQEEDSNSIGQFVGSLLPFGDKSAAVPNNVAEALSNGDVSKVTILRHGELFGQPESSPNFSPLRRGPLLNAQLCEEYTMRSARVDTKISNLMDKSSRTNRQSLGEVAALVATGEVPMSNGLDVCLSSQLGGDLNPVEFWESEFKRCINMLSDDGAQIFETAFSSVSDVPRLADWLATKWAPAVLRTYDIAAIRVGARPVFAVREGEDKVEIIWQTLIDMQTINTGKMIVQVTNSGLTATRAAGDSTKGYGSISPKPLAGEEVLLRRLAEAASQAIDKGLAKKPLVIRRKEKKVPVVPAVSSIQAAGDAVVEAPAPVVDRSSGPRSGTRRSRERARGSKKKSPPSTPKEE